MPNTLGLANKTGWMAVDLFPKVMDHFIEYSNASIDNPKLLIYDNYESYMSVAVLDLAKENGVTILTLPPHTSHMLQPLDKTCYAPFESS